MVKKNLFMANDEKDAYDQIREERYIFFGLFIIFV